jgi:tripartite-type tricarboxylate transporter receptor subunit TctC
VELLIEQGLASPKRLPQFPDTPTIAELGYPGFEAVAWIGLLAPARTSKDLIATLNCDIAEAVKSPEFAARLEAAGVQPRTDSAEAFAAYIKAEFRKWGELVRLSGAKVD